MKMLMALAASSAVSLAIGSTAFAQDAKPAADSAPAAAPAAAPAPAAEPAAAPGAPALPPIAAGKARIVFFRAVRLSGAFYTYHIVETGDDGKPPKDAPHLGDLPNGGAFYVDVDPGVHSYNITGPMAVNKAEDRLRLDLEPGETYYAEQTVRIGMFTGGFRLQPADQARFIQSHTKLKQ